MATRRYRFIGPRVELIDCLARLLARFRDRGRVARLGSPHQREAGIHAESFVLQHELDLGQFGDDGVFVNYRCETSINLRDCVRQLGEEMLDYEAANTLQTNRIFNLRGLSPTSYTRRALLAQPLHTHDLSLWSVASVCSQ
ncbi:hypothetical protein [Bradyrhizobium sp. STM 3557]|uniref:hypothetical protein n=1 Tax=Bradyrhizobium sp. STM 3557 TaxID=578920 RepID=UPI003890E0AB